MGYNAGMPEWLTMKYLQPGAYIAIMLAVLGVPQLLSGFFDRRELRLNRLENEANAERRHQERLDIEERREERRRQELAEQEERREERRREERAQQEELRRLEEERRREERAEREEIRRLEEERRRQDMELSERRHQEMMTALIAAIGNGHHQDDGQSELIRSLQQTVENLESEVVRLRQQNGNGSPST